RSGEPGISLASIRRNKRQELAAAQTQERGRQACFPHCGFPQSTWTEEHGVGENIAPRVVRMTWGACPPGSVSALAAPWQKSQRRISNCRAVFDHCCPN